LNGEFGELEATARVYYQTAPPKWMVEMFEEQSEEIDKFRALFEAADRQPILIKEKSVDVGSYVSNENLYESDIFAEVVTNLPSKKVIGIRSSEIHSYSVFSIDGTLIQRKSNNSGDYDITLEVSSGLYIIHFLDQSGNSIIDKIIIP